VIKSRRIRITAEKRRLGDFAKQKNEHAVIDGAVDMRLYLLVALVSIHSTELDCAQLSCEAMQMLSQW